MATISSIDKNKLVIPRKHFFPQVDQHTPFCVLEELLTGYEIPGDKDSLTHGDYLDFYNSLSSEPQELNREELVKYINPYTDVRRWSPTNLLSAYRYLISYADGTIKIPIDFEIGYQTPNKVTRVNLFIIYNKCLEAGVQLSYQSDAFEIEKAYRLLQAESNLYVKQLNRLLSLGLHGSIIPSLVKLPINLPEEDFVISNEINCYPLRKGLISESVYENYTGRYASIDEDIIPEDHAGAVILAALKYQINISYAKDPSLEFYLLNNCSIDQYQPLDSWMSYWYSINKDLFNLNLTFDAWFPKKFYRINQLGKKLLSLEGVELASDSESYDQLEIVHNQDNFYQGKRPGISNTESPISTELIANYLSSDILCYKVYREQVKTYAISKDDLLQYLHNTSTLVTPFNSSLIFSDQALNKIKIIFSSQEINDKIDHLKALVDSDCQEFRRFRQLYDQHPEQQEQVSKAVHKLLDLSMYMRGWDGQGSYPIESAITPPEFFDQLLINVTDCISDLEQLCNPLDDLDIRKLPLIFYNDKKYYRATNPDDGLTIGQRIQIIRQGEDTKNEASCIRISSNCIGASAHRILEILSIDPPFKIANLRHIL